jgi:hypothetical protein
MLAIFGTLKLLVTDDVIPLNIFPSGDWDLFSTLLSVWRV